MYWEMCMSPVATESANNAVDRCRMDILILLFSPICTPRDKCYWNLWTQCYMRVTLASMVITN